MNDRPTRALPQEHVEALEATTTRMNLALVDERVARSALQAEARQISLEAFHSQLSATAEESRGFTKKLMKLRSGVPLASAPDVHLGNAYLLGTSPPGEIRTPPYDYQWTRSSQTADTKMSADVNTGNLGIWVSDGFDDAEGSCFAALGIHIDLADVPQDAGSTIVVRYRFPYSYDYISWNTFAWSKTLAWYGLWLDAWDEQGNWVRTLNRDQISLWNQDNGGYSNIWEWGSTEVAYEKTFSFDPAERLGSLTCFAWCGGAAGAFGANKLFGWGYAETSLAATIPSISWVAFP